MAKKKRPSNFKGWGNALNILVKKPAKKVAKRATKNFVEKSLSIKRKGGKR